MACPILDVPPEILGLILHNIDGAPDLFSFALTCKAVYPQVVPRPFEWRVIKLPFRTALLNYWRAMVLHPAYLRHIRTLDTTGVGKICVPRSLVAELFSENAASSDTDTLGDTLIEMLQKTTSLTKLRISLGEHGLGFEDKFWHLVSSMPSLELLEIQDFSEHESVQEYDMRAFPSLRHFEYQSCAFRNATGSSRPLSCMFRAIFRASDLVSLTLKFFEFEGVQYAWFSADELFAGRWPNLKKLHLASPSGDPDMASTFLCAHPTIEDLSLVRGEYELLITPGPRTILPRLRRFSGSASQLLALLGPTDSLDICPLEDIRLDHPSDSKYAIWGPLGLAPTPLTLHLRRITTLVRFEDRCGHALSHPDQFKFLTSAIGGVEILSLPELIFKIQRRDEASWMEGFSFLRELKVFNTGTYSNMGGSGVSSEFARRVASICTSLTFVGDRHLGGWWITGRTGDGSAPTMVDAVLSEDGIPIPREVRQVYCSTGLYEYGF
ncbi:hypothetical protein C8R44DRAFT_915231 [Mycena epipterygia]|nr:hypothetical protein C8R44DRAFT_915231 [Mycena epipterygia]